MCIRDRYRIVQEALANVRRHSTARHARAIVRVDEPDGTIEVEVVDDGSPRPGTSGTGLGLLGMRERAHHLGGGVETGPRRGGPGWRVRVWLPLDGHRSAPDDDPEPAPDARSSPHVDPEPAPDARSSPPVERDPAPDARSSPDTRAEPAPASGSVPR